MKASIIIGGKSFLGSTVRKYDPDGILLWSLDHGATVRAVTTDSGGNVIVVGDRASDNKTTRKYGPNGGSPIWSADHGDSVYSVTVDSSDNVITGGVVSGGVTTRKYDSSGTPGWTQNHGATIYGVSVDGSDNVVEVGAVSSSVSVRKRSASDGSSSWTANHGATVRAVQVDTDGSVYIAGDKTSNIIARKYNSSGTLQVSYTSDSTYIVGNGFGLVVTGSEVIVGGDTAFTDGASGHINAFSKSSNTLSWFLSDYSGELYDFSEDADGNILYVGQAYASSQNLKSFDKSAPISYNWFRWVGADIYSISSKTNKPCGTTTITETWPNQTSIRVVFTQDYDYEVDGYDYRLDGGSASTASVSGNIITISGLSAATEYDIEIRPTNSSGNGAWSSLVTETTEDTDEVFVARSNSTGNAQTPPFTAPKLPATYASWSSYPLGSSYLNMREAWGINYGDPGVSVAVADAGFYVDHPALEPKIQEPSYNAVDGSDFVQLNYDNGHGTEVAGIVAADPTVYGLYVSGAAGAGVKVRIVLVDDDSEQWAYTPDGLIWAADNGCRVINVSAEWPNLHTQVYEDLMTAGEYFESKGGVVVAAIGNSPFGETFVDNYPRQASWVQVTGSNSAFTHIHKYGNASDLTSFAASVPTTTWGGGYGARAGTSMAAPLVTSIVHLIQSVNPFLGPADVREILFSTSTNPDNPGGWTQKWGWGFLDPVAALNMASVREPQDLRGVAWMMDRQSKTVDGSAEYIFNDSTITGDALDDVFIVSLVYEDGSGNLGEPVYLEVVGGDITMSSAVISSSQVHDALLNNEVLSYLDFKVLVVEAIKLDGLVVVQETATDDLDGLVVVEDVSTDTLDGILQVATVTTKDLDAKTLITSTTVNLLDGKVDIASSVAKMLDGKIIISDVVDRLLDLKTTISNFSTSNVDFKLLLASAVNKSLDGKVIIEEAVANLVDGKLMVTQEAVELLDGLIGIQTNATKLLDQKVNISDLVTKLLDSLVAVSTKVDKLLDGKVIISTNITKLLDGVVEVLTAGTANKTLHGKVRISNVGVSDLDYKAIVGATSTGLVDGKLLVSSGDVDLLDLKTAIQSIGTISLDGKVTFSDVVSEALDGKLVISIQASSLLDGLVEVVDIVSTSNLLDNRLVIQNDASKLLDGKLAITTLVIITPSGRTYVISGGDRIIEIYPS